MSSFKVFAKGYKPKKDSNLEALKRPKKIEIK